MTIDEAIKYADMLSCNVNAFEVSKQFGAMCADAAAGKMSVPELAQHLRRTHGRNEESASPR